MGEKRESPVEDKGKRGGGKRLAPGDTVMKRLRSVLGFTPSVQLRNLSAESSATLEPDREEGKYIVEREIGKGGMGQVFLAFDRDLRRHVAVKVIQTKNARDPEHLARFVEEAQITGQLEHPGIPPVHELAINQNQEVFFSLKLLRGRTLKDILLDLHIGRRDVRERFSRTRLLQIFLSVCNAVHFAHEKGVLHRDIKPDNIMLGDYGEVQLMDWGLAKVIGHTGHDEGVEIEEQVETVRTEQQMATAHGSVRGTLQYMAPEQAQARGDQVDPRSDVYSLGATLYEVLTLLPPKTGSSVTELLEESRMGLILPPSRRAPKQRVPEELESICMKALEYHPDDRYQSALELAEAVQIYLDGTLEKERRRAESEELLKDAQAVLRRYESDKRVLEQARDEIDAFDDTNFPSREDKREFRKMVARREQKEISTAQQYTKAQTLLSAALAANPANSRARQLLGELYIERFERAEREKNTMDAILFRGLIDQVNDGRFDRLLHGAGSMRVVSEPRGAEMTLLRYEEVDGVLEPKTEISRARSELVMDELEMGSYLVRIEADRCFPANYPVLLDRNRDVREVVKLYPADRIPPGFAYVPRGPFLMFGDPNVLSSFSISRTVHVPGFAIGVFPVTCGEYLDFLNAIAASDPGAARRRAPRQSEQTGFLWKLEGGQFSLPEPNDPPWSERLPVFGISFEDAVAYCRFRSRQDGMAYDLPTEPEWEKAAKGVDARFFSWGNHFDNEFTNNFYARPNSRGVVDVDLYPRDCSPYGVRGMVGNVSDFCYLEGSDRPDMIAVRGGNWAITGDPCRIATRRSTTRSYVSDRLGFRLKLALESDAE